METIILGQAAIVNKGAYSGSASYGPLDMVTNLGGSFLCKATCTAVEPGVTNGWASYWTAMAKGIKTYSLSVSGGVATVNIVFTDGSTYSTTYSTAAIGAGTVGTTELADGAVTAAKLNSNVNYQSIGLNSNQVRPIYITDTVPTASSPQGIYLVTEG